MILIALAVVTCVIAGLITYARWNFGTLEKMGIPVVPYHPLFGSAKEIYEKVGGLNDIKWMKKYGKIFGVYEGREPQVFIGVPELVRLICVKDSAYFDSKRMLDFGDPVMNEMPDFLPLEKWKLVRSLTTPTFSSAKIKLMNLPMKEATLDFISDIRKKIKASGKGLYEKLAIDVAIHTMLTDLIGRCVFSVQISNRDNETNEFAKLVQELVTPAENFHSKHLVVLTHSFPILRKMMSSVIFKPEPVEKFTKIFKQMMDVRRKSGKKHNDVVDLCLEWYDRLDSPEFKSAKINELTIIAQALVFFFAAQDQISTMVSTAIFHMTQNEEISRKAYEEVDKIFTKHNGKVEHEHLHEFVYLNAMLQECLRLYVFFHRMERVCTKDWKNEEYGLSFRKGQVIQFPIWAINRCEDYNENAETFDPERFMPENKDKMNPYSSTSFGFGPRNCTGKRFATEAMPLILGHILRDFHFSARKDSKIKFIPGGPFFTPHEPIYVDVKERSKVVPSNQ